MERVDLLFPLRYPAKSLVVFYTLIGSACFDWKRLAWGCLLLLLVAVDGKMAQAEGPSLAFDFAHTLECREVSLESSSNIEVGKKVIQLDLRLSVRVLSGSIGDVDEIRIELSDCDERMRVHQFSPTTQLESPLRADSRWSRTVETSHSYGGTLGGEAPVPLGSVVAQVTPSIQGALSKRESVTESETRVAPKHVVVASGTILQEHGVFFSFRPSLQSSLEGTHRVSVEFIVPENWRGDVLTVRCQAKGEQKMLWMRQEKTWAISRAPVALYLAGDLQAQLAAQRHVRVRAD